MRGPATAQRSGVKVGFWHGTADFALQRLRRELGGQRTLDGRRREDRS